MYVVLSVYLTLILHHISFRYRHNSFRHYCLQCTIFNELIILSIIVEWAKSNQYQTTAIIIVSLGLAQTKSVMLLIQIIQNTTFTLNIKWKCIKLEQFYMFEMSVGSCFIYNINLLSSVYKTCKVIELIHRTWIVTSSTNWKKKNNVQRR